MPDTDAYIIPNSLPEALKAAKTPGIAVVAGGTDFFPSLQDKPPPRRILDVSGLKEIRGVSRQGEFWKIGAATRWSEIVAAGLPSCFDGLKAAALEIGSIQIQNQGTIAGNLCNASPAADSVPPLLTLDAEVETESEEGARRMPLEKFLTGPRATALKPGELMTAVYARDPGEGTQSGFVKLGSRKYLVISIAMAASAARIDAAGRIERARVAVGACSPVARRIEMLERALEGCEASEAAVADRVSKARFEELSPISDVRASGEYRRRAAAEICKRAVMAAIKEGGKP